MTDKLSTLRNFIARLADQGITVVCVGGAARDTYLGIEPKDFDLVVLNADVACQDVFDALHAAAGRLPRILGHEEIADYQPEEGHRDRGLEYVLDVAVPHDGTGFADLAVQVLIFDQQTTLRYDGDPYAVVVDHDCSLNHAWLEDVNGTLRARVGEEFPSPFTGNFNNFRPGWSNTRRMTYVMSKFPEYNHR